MSHYNIVAQCPYYGRENQTTIFCESVSMAVPDADQYTAHVFENGGAKNRFMRQHCAMYPDMNCPHAAYMEQAYLGGKK